MNIVIVAFQLWISIIDMSTSNNLIIDIKNKGFLLVRIVFLICEIGISISKKSILDINNWF